MSLLGTEKLPGEPLPPCPLLCARHRGDGSLLAYVISGRMGVTEQLLRATKGLPRTLCHMWFCL